MFFETRNDITECKVRIDKMEVKQLNEDFYLRSMFTKDDKIQMNAGHNE